MTKQLPEIQALVLKILKSYKGSPLTAKEICMYADKENLGEILRDMEKSGLILAKDKKVCMVTNKMCPSWSIK
jgi:predicted Zn-ribbon and HTH transcriptional regulator